VHELNALSPRVAELVDRPGQCGERFAKSFTVTAVCVCCQQLMDKLLIVSLHNSDTALYTSASSHNINCALVTRTAPATLTNHVNHKLDAPSLDYKPSIGHIIYSCG